MHDHGAENYDPVIDSGNLLALSKETDDKPGVMKNG